jgi:hypothetical protein
MFDRFKVFLKRRVAAKVIRFHDMKADAQYDSTSCALPEGYNTFKIDNLLEAEGITQRLINSELREKLTKDQNIHLSWCLPDFLWEAILNSQNLFKIASNYLGPDVRLDDLYLKTVRDGLSSASESWHDDNVGYRLKVFMVFDTEGIPSDTVLIPSQRPNLYKINFDDEVVRAKKQIKSDTRHSSIRVKYAAGDCLAFDTNLSHRGDYTNSQGVRHCIIAEFIDRSKGNALRGKAPCGPGQGKQKVKIPYSTLASVEKSPLIDKRLLEVANQEILYGY